MKLSLCVVDPWPHLHDNYSTNKPCHLTIFGCPTLQKIEPTTAQLSAPSDNHWMYIYIYNLVHKQLEFTWYPIIICSYILHLFICIRNIYIYDYIWLLVVVLLSSSLLYIIITIIIIINIYTYYTTPCCSKTPAISKTLLERFGQGP